ncbi:MAG: hypothetical protein F6K23_37990 [Okeania sp. SIO2C9]|uniref:hypothetical protein n=1 Tax=Okeania sp. SIO2C9 TaxID=2607791 RepID=UPI0013C00301|nr:hypothetical protein [Okeania sp. SIO2C9]NEQ78277.1 hypothetical protein [Okeania sp. SIO2C9]
MQLFRPKSLHFLKAKKGSKPISVNALIFNQQTLFKNIEGVWGVWGDGKMGKWENGEEGGKFPPFFPILFL